MRCYVTLTNVFQLMHINMIPVFTADERWRVIRYVYVLLYCPRAYGGGFLGFQETPFDSKAISKTICLNK